MGQSLRKFADWARKARNVLRKGEMLRQAKMRIAGHLNYYAITDNSESVASMSFTRLGYYLEPGLEKAY